MGIFPGFGAWINLNNQQPPKAESKKSKNVKSKPGSEINTNEESEETKRQLKMWRAEEKEFQWLRDNPPTVKVSKSSIGETHLEMDFSIGLPPETVFDIVTSHDNRTYSYFKQMKRRKILEVKSSKVLRDNGRDEKVVVVKKSAPWKFLWWDGKMPIDLVFNENRKDLIVRNLHKYQSSCSVWRKLKLVLWTDII
ncbi:OBP32pep protein [Hirschfeldia incana]|nr:OBP32pep protein [Hirschfeldia incana]